MLTFAPGRALGSDGGSTFATTADDFTRGSLLAPGCASPGADGGTVLAFTCVSDVANPFFAPAGVSFSGWRAAAPAVAGRWRRGGRRYARSVLCPIA